MSEKDHCCEGCGEWMTAQESCSHSRTTYDVEGNPQLVPCGPVICAACHGVGWYVSLPGDVISPCPYCGEDEKP